MSIDHLLETELALPLKYEQNLSSWFLMALNLNCAGILMAVSSKKRFLVCSFYSVMFILYMIHSYSDATVFMS